MKMALRSQPRKGRKISSTSLYLSPLQGWESSATFYPVLVPGATFLRRSAAPTPLNSMLLITGKSTVVEFEPRISVLQEEGICSANADHCRFHCYSPLIPDVFCHAPEGCFG